jgi:ATP-dependent Lon protease
MELQDKITKHFEGKVVRKDLTSRVKGNAVVPTYVLKYLQGQYCAINAKPSLKQVLKKSRMSSKTTMSTSVTPRSSNPK